MFNSAEHIEYINDRLRLIVSPAHTFGTDALLLAAFSMPKQNAKCIDFGTGCGIIPFYWIREGVRNVCAVELQSLACDQLRRSIKLSGIGERFTLIEGDLTKLKGVLPFGGFDTVSMNPPYTPAGNGILSASEADKTARHETNLTFAALCRSASDLLKFGGSFSICLRPESIPLSAHVRGKCLIDERLQSLCLVLFRNGTYDGVAYDVAAAVNHIGGGISKDVGGKLSRLTI